MSKWAGLDGTPSPSAVSRSMMKQESQLWRVITYMPTSLNWELPQETVLILSRSGTHFAVTSWELEGRTDGQNVSQVCLV